MNDIIYCSIIVPASKSADNIPERVVVTQEVNGCAVWREGHDGQKLLTFTSSFDARDKAIEFAVDTARRLRGESAGAPDLRAAAIRAIAALAANGAPNCEAVKELRAALAKAEAA